MTDREKVIKGLICHVHGDPHTRCHKCPYWGTGPHGLSQCSQLFADALAILNALLKAQEPVSIEERLVLDKLHTIQDYARVNEIHWMADGAAFAENVMNMLRGEINQFRKAQEPRVMKVTEVIACEVGTVLWVEERQGVTWNLFPLEIDVSSTHPDTGTNYLFFITYHDIRKFECSEYNQTWRCWTQHPTNEQKEATPWPMHQKSTVNCVSGICRMASVPHVERTTSPLALNIALIAFTSSICATCSVTWK